MKIKLLTLLLALLLLLLPACTPTTPPDGPNTGDNGDNGDQNTPTYETITIAEALELCGEPGNITTERYYIRGTVESISNAEYGSMTVKDETGTISVYGTYSADGELYFNELTDKPARGDTVVLHCILQNYSGTKEVKNARLMEVVHAEKDLTGYTAATIAQARAAKSGDKLKVSGTVVRITYSNGQKPAGVMLMDEAGDSIYVYDAYTAGSVKIGNKIEVAASKAYWILDTEQTNAAKFDYLGCNQLEDVTLLSNDNKTDNALPFANVKSSTVKAIMDTAFDQDITTAVYRVTALVKKVPGSGFVNYYINDLDDATGSYVYTQCNGSDFAWLDAFDGKICTVYLTALNAKASTSGCVWRLLPVAVYDEGFTFDLNTTAEHVVKYYGVDQFLPTYSGDPALELTTSVSSALLGFENAALTYTSSNESVAAIVTEGGKTVLHCKDAGQVTITVTAAYEGKTYSETVTVTVIKNQDIDSTNVAGAIAAAKGETVTVTGIVGPSLVNKTGFYLIDESGVIAIETDGETMKTIAIGNKVTLTGTRHINTKGGAAYYGQTCIKSAEILANEYGNHAYSDATFVTDKTLAEFYALDPKTDYTTTVFVLRATIAVEESDYYTNIHLISGSTNVRLYCSSAKQYNWLKEFAGEEVTIEVAACNWNDKNYYTGCILAVRTDDGKVLNTLNFNQ